MTEYRVECPCGAVVSEDDQALLITKVKQHAKEAHDMEMTDDQVKEMIKTKAS